MPPKQCFPNFSAHRNHPGCLLKMQVLSPLGQTEPSDADAAGPGPTWAIPLQGGFPGVGQVWREWEGVRRGGLNLCGFLPLVWETQGENTGEKVQRAEPLHRPQLWGNPHPHTL